MHRAPLRFTLASVERFCDAGALAMIVSGAAAFLALSPLGGGLTAQYGRHHASRKASPSAAPGQRRRRRGLLSALLPSSLPARWAWLTQELPALLLAPAAFALTLRALREEEDEKAGKSQQWWAGRWPSSSNGGGGSASSLLRLLSAAPLPNRLLLLAFALHYSWRSLFYPLLIRGGKETRALEWALALVFCCWNGALQGAGAALVGRRRGRGRAGRRESAPCSSPFYLALFGVSLCLWALFWGLNLAADAHLRSLRRRKKKKKTGRATAAAVAAKAAAGATATATARNGGRVEDLEEEEEEEEDRGYRIPTSPLFSLVACPNYGAECAEWAAFAAASFFASRAAGAGAGAVEGGRSSGSSGGVAAAAAAASNEEALPSLAFALFTAANLVPRALAHRRWYAEKFEDFPRGRRAIFPWVL